MAIELKQLLDTSIANMGTKMNPIVKESALEVIRRAYAEKIYVQMTSGYRTAAAQNKLYAQGRTDKSKPIVTNAKAGESSHNYGVAVDFVIVSEDGKRALWTVNDQWNRVVVIAKSLGFAWGGDWNSFKDYPHLEMLGGLTIKNLQAGRKPALVLTIPPPEPTDTKKYRINTGVFATAEGLVSGKSLINAKYNWLLYEKAESTGFNPGYRIYTGTFIGKNVADYYAEELKKEFNWTVYVQEI